MKKSIKEVIVLLVCSGFMSSTAFAGFACQSAGGDVKLTAEHDKVQDVFISTEDQEAFIKIEKKSEEVSTFESLVSKQTNRVESYYQYEFQEDLNGVVSFFISDSYTVINDGPGCHMHSRAPSPCDFKFVLKHKGQLQLNGESYALDCKIL